MDVPTVNKVFGMFPVKYATFLISLFSLGVGGVGLAGIILYGLVDNHILSSKEFTYKADNPLKKAVLLMMGLSSLLLFISGALLLLGVTFNMKRAVSIGAWVIFGMCVINLTLSLGGPLMCFFLPSSCLIKQISSATMVMGYLCIMVFLLVWFYCMVVVFNYVMQK